MGSLKSRLAHQFAILDGCGEAVPRGARVLDLGCGEGEDVWALSEAGYVANGCDVEMRDTPRALELIRSGRLQKIPMAPYRLPYDDNEFDLILSRNVLEHVQNYPELVDELYRIMKPGAVSLNLFPPRWMLVEPHLFVPFGTFVSNKRWLSVWARLGIRNRFQKGMKATEVAEFNHNYLLHHTNYLPKREIAKQFGRRFSSVRFVEAEFLKHSRRGRVVYPVARVLPMLISLYSECWNRVLLIKK